MYALSVDAPLWSSGRRQRLQASLLLSLGVVVGLLSVLKLPLATSVAPLAELIVNRVRQEAPAVVEPERPTPVAMPSQVARRDSPVAAESVPIEVVPAEAVPVIEQPSTPAVDWRRQIVDAVADIKAENAPASLNPGLDERRRIAAERYAPLREPPQRPVWENVERDLMGRSVLRSGDCYKVIDDPNVGSREAFETFGQYIAICAKPRRKPQQLEWVAEINARRANPSRHAPPFAE